MEEKFLIQHYGNTIASYDEVALAMRVANYYAIDHDVTVDVIHRDTGEVIVAFDRFGSIFYMDYSKLRWED